LDAIGKFGRLAGLSIHTLRHYDDIGLLVPADVSDGGQRRYDRSQLERARRIRALRWTGLPLDEIAVVLDGGGSARDALDRHRDALRRRQSRDADAIQQITRMMEGKPMNSTLNTARPVQIKLLVRDVDEAAAFYADAFGFDWRTTQRTDDEDFNGFVFGSWDHPDFFLIHLQTADQLGAVGPATFGITVDDLDAAHARAISAGAEEVRPPHDLQGMPRSSVVKDPDGNVAWLYQA
jgi:DNA-binding transcriptional MerR regulator